MFGGSGDQNISGDQHVPGLTHFKNKHSSV